ncbi:NB-ARC domain-containing protein [Amycolatopsis sp. NPDC003731]
MVSGGKGVVVGRRNIQNNNFFSLWPSRRFVAPEFSPVPDLAGRASELAALADAFAGNLSRPTVRVLTGESGVGKSALAAAHGRRHHDRYGSMVWIDARDPDQIAELCRNVLNVVAPGEADVDNPVDVLLHGYLANQDKRWLLVMDDVRHPNLIRRLIPAAGAGDVIVTSAATGWRDHVAIDVGPLGFEAATSLLLPPAGASPEPVARALAAFLGGSPRELIRARETLAANPAVDWTDYLRLDSTGQADTYATNSDHAAQVTGRAHRNCVAAGSLQEGHQELFVVDRDRRLVHRWNDLEQPHGPRARSGWSRWWLMNEPEPVHRVGCSSLDAGHLEVFAVTDDQGLIHRWREGSPARWSPWRVLATPGKIIALDVGSARDGSQDLFVVTTDGHVYTRGFDRDRGDWTGWVGFGAPEPVVGVAWSGMNRSRGHRELFAVTKSGRVLHRWNHLDAGEDWSDWADMDAPGRVRSATAGSPRRAQQDLIVVLGDGTVFSRRYGRTGHEWDPEWTSMSALEPIVAITSSSLTTGHLELFATTVHGALLHRWYWASTGWSEWELFERAPQTP